MILLNHHPCKTDLETEFSFQGETGCETSFIQQKRPQLQVSLQPKHCKQPLFFYAVFVCMCLCVKLRTPREAGVKVPRVAHIDCCDSEQKQSLVPIHSLPRCKQTADSYCLAPLQRHVQHLWLWVTSENKVLNEVTCSSFWPRKEREAQFVTGGVKASGTVVSCSMHMRFMSM